MPELIGVEYFTDKETKKTYRFKPKDASIIGNVTIYLAKTFLSENGIDPEKGFHVVIIANE